MTRSHRCSLRDDRPAPRSPQLRFRSQHRRWRTAWACRRPPWTCCSSASAASLWRLAQPSCWPLEPMVAAAHGASEAGAQTWCRSPRSARCSLPRRPRLPVKLGDVDAFLLERVTHEEGARVSWAEAFLSYRGWCDGSGCSPVDAKAFGARLDALRDELGLKVRTRAKTCTLSI